MLSLFGRGWLIPIPKKPAGGWLLASPATATSTLQGCDVGTSILGRGWDDPEKLESSSDGLCGQFPSFHLMEYLQLRLRRCFMIVKGVAFSSHNLESGSSKAVSKGITGTMKLPGAHVSKIKKQRRFSSKIHRCHLKSLRSTIDGPRVRFIPILTF